MISTINENVETLSVVNPRNVVCNLQAQFDEQGNGGNDDSSNPNLHGHGVLHEGMDVDTTGNSRGVESYCLWSC